jgi:hypothetical protein
VHVALYCVRLPCSETRYLLLLTENYGGLGILSENLLADQDVVPIFGSSFPRDQEYTQVCVL